MRGRRRGLGLGNYTLGDRYITPDRRLSQMLMRQGSRGGPSDSWQETLGRIAQQLSGAYIGKLDQDKQDIANQAFAKVEPDSFRPPTDAEAMATPGMRDLELSAMTGIAGDGRGQTVTAPLPDDQLMGQGNIPDIMEKIGRYNQNMGKPGALGDEILQQGLDLQTQKFNQEMNQSRQASNVPRPRDFKAELAQGMQGYQQDPSNRVMNEKMPQIEYAMQNLRGLENNPYAQRLLQGLMMNQMNTDVASRLDATARERQLADAARTRGFDVEDAIRDRGYSVEDRDIRTGSTAPKSQEKSLPDGMTQRQIYVNGAWVDDGVPYDKNLRSLESQAQAINRGQASKSYFDPEAYKKKETIKADAKGDSYSKKPMPASALKVQDDHIAAINTSKGLDADLGKWDEMITSGELDLGFFTNPLNAAKTYTGFDSDEQSRNYSSFRTSLEKMRNESLRLNKGIQTEGDAQRIWNELISKISDEEFVSQRLKELQAVNQRAVDIRKYQIDSIRNNYGKGPLDEAPEPKAIPGSGGVDLVYVPGQGLVPEKRGQ